MFTDIVETITNDGVTLAGAFFAPDHSDTVNSTAILLVHGTYGNFYSPILLQHAKVFVDHGHAVASFNTRGHDGISVLKQQPLLFGGTAFENLADSISDLNACIAWVQNRGFEKIAILGISMGAVKVVYYQAKIQNPAVSAVIAVSPVRLSKKYYLKTEAKDLYEYYNDTAHTFVNESLPDAVMNIRESIVPGTGFFGAQAYLDKYGGEDFDITHLGESIACPILVMAGTEETHPRLNDCAKDLATPIQHRNDVELIMVEKGTHGLRELGSELPLTVMGWMARNSG